MSEKISFDVDWDALFPGKEFTVGSMTHTVRPLDIQSIAKISKKIKSFIPMIQKDGINLTNVGNPENIVKLAEILIDNAPEIISDATMINIESLVKFPPQYLLELVTIAIEVNIESKEALEKNFKSLTKTLQNLQN